MDKMEKIIGLGRRKSSVAHASLSPIKDEKNKITINGKSPETFFPNKIIIQDMMQPLALLNEKAGYFEIKAKVDGGGFTGQAGAIRLAIANALVKYDKKLKKDLKAAKLITQDRRVKERKKFGKYGARRSPQFVKR
ncbi:MAG: 30S ribosomal protein S9 [Mycoplasmataceae bacterium]|jgi:small subunit ribosomal protein S9|nr:30S ribosomal protein S9 [Mycoplasmataceae bacterium]